MNSNIEFQRCQDEFKYKYESENLLNLKLKLRLNNQLFLLLRLLHKSS